MPEEKELFVSYEVLARALFENYESIYDIDSETHAYSCYHQSESYQRLKLESSGEDFFASLPDAVPRVIAPEDQAYVLRMLDRDTLLAGVTTQEHYNFIYRVQTDGEGIYHQIRAVRRPVEGKIHILLGVKNVDDLIRQEMAHRDEIDSMRQKERNYLQAVLGAAAGYIEANLTTNRITERSTQDPEDPRRRIRPMPSTEEVSCYDDLQAWICEHLLCGRTDRYRQVSSSEWLLKCFARGDRRASVSFSVLTVTGDVQPCREVFYLYRERVTEDVHVLCVIYDLTEQQQRENEVKALEQELAMSRIRNSTSQMQPHFLYNALGSIQEVILTDPDYASELLGDFTVHLRSCVRAMASDDPIPFSQELENIHAYVNIEKMRFGKKLSIEYEIEDSSFYVLPLSIQPLVENAIRHGVYERGKQGGTVRVRSRLEEDGARIVIEDNGVGFDVEQYRKEMREGTRDSTGLANIRFRLEKMLQATVDVESTPGEGTRVEVFIPSDCGAQALRKAVPTGTAEAAAP